MEQITLQEFTEAVSGAPFTIEEVANEAIKISDCDELSEAAQEFLDAFEVLKDTLTDYDIEIG